MKVKSSIVQERTKALQRPLTASVAGPTQQPAAHHCSACLLKESVNTAQKPLLICKPYSLTSSCRIAAVAPLPAVSLFTQMATAVSLDMS